MNIFKIIIPILIMGHTLLANSIVLNPYVTDYPFNFTDENSVIGTKICRMSLENGPKLTESESSITLSNSSDFAVKWYGDGSCYIVNSKVFDYESGKISYPLTITINFNGEKVSRTIDIGINPKNDINAKSKNIAVSMKEDTTLSLDIRELNFVTDADLPSSENSWALNSIAQMPLYGTLIFDKSGKMVYDPTEKGVEFTVDSFAYYIDDSTTYDVTKLRSLTPYWVIVNIRNVNDEPVVGHNDTISVDEEGTISKTTSGLENITTNDFDLDNSIDRDGDGVIDITRELEVKLLSPSVSSQGELILNRDGTFKYIHNSGFNNDIFLYEVTDGIHSDTAQVIISINPINNSIPIISFDTLLVKQGEFTTQFEDGDNSLLDKILDDDMPLDSLSISIDSDSTSGGIFELKDNGEFKYTHLGARIFDDSIFVTVTDKGGHSNSSFLYVKIEPSSVPTLALTVIPLTGVIPTEFILPTDMKSSVDNLSSNFMHGTACDINFNRAIENSDLSVEANLFDALGNTIASASLDNPVVDQFVISKIRDQNGVRIFWNGRNSTGRAVESGSYLLSVIVIDSYSGEKITAKSLWGIKHSKMFENSITISNRP